MEWKISTAPVEYEEAVAFMEQRVAAIRKAEANELVWLLEHPALFTAGSGAQDADLLDTLGFPVFRSGRGGQYTYHGPGQRVAYVMLDLKKRGADVRAYVENLERWIIRTLSSFGIEAFTREGRVGVWVDSLNIPLLEGGSFNTEAKIAAIGVRIRGWVTYHGIALNVSPDLSHYRGIVPCGIQEFGVTSLKALCHSKSLEEVDAALQSAFGDVFKN